MAHGLYAEILLTKIQFECEEFHFTYDALATILSRCIDLQGHLLNERLIDADGDICMDTSTGNESQSVSDGNEDFLNIYNNNTTRQFYHIDKMASVLYETLILVGSVWMENKEFGNAAEVFKLCYKI
eukprot:TRINITY_DN2479_c0_g1_i1.p1 TRINITY_DN2479_c0_g1~~TRINITY_DN2479_c0_g1_i1.p1  ORF type:complete len:142 (+),score=18.30 TRINITY_DN2479_c0_g1_i1:47-427(+)